MNDDLQFKLPPRENFDDLTMKLGQLGKRVRLIVQVKEKVADNGDEKEQEAQNDNSNNNNDNSNKKSDDAGTSKEASVNDADMTG